MYHGEDYDVAGFCVGVVEKSEIIDGSKVADGDVLVALASSGPHSNGYSLVRKILEVSGCDPLTTELDGKPLADHLLAPTRIYVKNVLELIENVDVHAIAHLTGGGFWENIPRVLPDNTRAVIDASSWQWPSVFNWLQTAGNVSEHEMYRTFNCGVGMVIALPASEADKAIKLLTEKVKTRGKSVRLKLPIPNSVWSLNEKHRGAHFRQRKQFAGNHRRLQTEENQWHHSGSIQQQGRCIRP